MDEENHLSSKILILVPLTKLHLELLMRSGIVLTMPFQICELPGLAMASSRGSLGSILPSSIETKQSVVWIVDSIPTLRINLD